MYHIFQTKNKPHLLYLEIWSVVYAPENTVYQSHHNKLYLDDSEFQSLIKYYTACTFMMQ